MIKVITLRKMFIRRGQCLWVANIFPVPGDVQCNVVGYKFGMLFINVKQMFQHVDTVMWI